MVRKNSKQRQLIKDFLLSRKDHPTADVVYMNVRQQLPNISLGTVYRNLTLLADMGEIQRLRVGDGVDHFDADISEHGHFICNECGGVLDLDLDMDDAHALMEKASRHFDGLITNQITYFYGKCANCLSPITTK